MEKVPEPGTGPGFQEDRGRARAWGPWTGVSVKSRRTG